MNSDVRRALQARSDQLGHCAQVAFCCASGGGLVALAQRGDNSQMLFADMLRTILDLQVAVCYAMRHPELFAGAILLSPFVQDAHAPASSRAATGGAFAGADGQYDEDLWRRSNYPGLLAEYTAKSLPVSMYIYTGDDDWNHLSAKEDLPEDAWRYNIEYQAVKLYLALKSQNPLGAASPKGENAPRDTAQLRVVDGGHNETVWIQGFIKGLQYIERQGFGAVHSYPSQGYA